MPIGSIFVNNRTQAIGLPAETRFPDHVRKVTVRVSGKDRVLSPVENTWDSFFLSSDKVTDDFMTKRAAQDSKKLLTGGYTRRTLDRTCFSCRHLKFLNKGYRL